MKENKKFVQRLITSNIGSFFVILPYVKPASEITGSFDIFFDLWKLFAGVLIFIGCVGEIRCVSKIVYPIVMIQCTLLLSTLINRGDYKAAIVQVISNISIVLYFDYYLRHEPKKALKRIATPIVFMSLLTVLSMFVFYPTGMYGIGGNSSDYVEYGNYLWGFDNASIFNFVPGMFFVGLYSYMADRRKTYKKTIIFYLLVTVAFYYVFSITAFLGCFTILSLYIATIVKKKKMCVLNTKVIVFLILFLGLLLILFNDRIGLLMEFAKRTDKFYSIKSRFIIWDLAFSYWQSSPLFGWGIETKKQIISKLILDHPHNYFIDILYRGGLIGIMGVAWMFATFFRRRWKDIRINSFSAVCLFVMLIISQFDYYNDHYLFYPLILVALYSRKIRNFSD